MERKVAKILVVGSGKPKIDYAKLMEVTKEMGVEVREVPPGSKVKHTVMIDGKPVELTRENLVDVWKKGR